MVILDAHLNHLFSFFKHHPFLSIFFLEAEKVRQWDLEMSLNVLSHSGDSPSRTSCLSQDFSISEGTTSFVPSGLFTWFTKMCQAASILRDELRGREKSSLKKVKQKTFSWKRCSWNESLGKARCSVWIKESWLIIYCFHYSSYVSEYAPFLSKAGRKVKAFGNPM